MGRTSSHRQDQQRSSLNLCMINLFASGNCHPDLANSGVISPGNPLPMTARPKGQKPSSIKRCRRAALRRSVLETHADPI
jgi:hypothetical protein